MSLPGNMEVRLSYPSGLQHAPCIELVKRWTFVQDMTAQEAYDLGAELQRLAQQAHVAGSPLDTDQANTNCPV